MSNIPPVKTALVQHSSSSVNIRVSALHAGSLTLPEHFFCADQHDKTIRNTVPSLSFLLQHPSGKRIIFDLGMRRDPTQYLPQIQSHLQSRQPITTLPDVAASLRAGDLEPGDIDAVILSHVHYDHVGTPSDFSNAVFVVGPGTKHLLKHGMKYHSAAHFEPDLLPEDRTIELPDPEPENGSQAQSAVFDHVQLKLGNFLAKRAKWAPLLPFHQTIDLFNDGSLYIISAPGHLQGHINVLARIGVKRWVYLAGDACHHPRILRGETEMASWEEGGMVVCIHEDKAKAEETVRRIAVASTEGLGNGMGQVEVILAHDREWADLHGDAFLPGCV
jgi:glyoxylase-like metal-dependent hydrolase (beta-lactamase superfamily II)